MQGKCLVTVFGAWFAAAGCDVVGDREAAVLRKGEAPPLERNCHPLAPACPEGEVCIPATEGDAPFVCAIGLDIAGENPNGCSWANDCAAGYFCEQSWCVEFCEVGGAECVNCVAYEPASPGFEDVGVCR